MPGRRDDPLDAVQPRRLREVSASERPIVHAKHVAPPALTLDVMIHRGVCHGRQPDYYLRRRPNLDPNLDLAGSSLLVHSCSWGSQETPEFLRYPRCFLGSRSPCDFSG